MRQHVRSLIILASAVTATAGAAEISGRGIHPLDSHSGCPFSTANSSCNRIALDDAHTRATVDPTARKVSFHNTQRYDDTTTVADLLVHGTGEKADGARVPLSFHLVLSKEDDEWSVNRHVHAPSYGAYSNVSIDAYTVEVNGDDGRPETLLTPAQMRELLAQPKIMTRLANELVEVKDNRAVMAGTPDITISIGRGKLAKPVLRARLSAPVAGADLEAVLQSDSWAIELEALTGQIPTRVVKRELFLYQLDQLTLLRTLLRDGFRKRDKLVIGADKGKGFIRFQDKQQEFAAAAQAGRSFMQQSFIGLILGSQQLERSAKR